MKIDDLTRRTFLNKSIAMSSMALVPNLMSQAALAGGHSGTMVIAAPATPQSLDCEYDVSLGTFEAVAALYDGLVEFEKMPDASVPTAQREDTAYYADKSGGVNMKGKLAESWELQPDGKRIVFKLREGVMSNWGNELTAEDVKWTWDRKFGLAAIGGFYTKVSGLSRPEDVRVEGKYTISFNLDNPNPLILKIHPNLIIQYMIQQNVKR